jgi:hypothetical protein
MEIAQLSTGGGNHRVVLHRQRNDYGTERRYGAGGEDGNFVAASNDGVPRCPSRTT